MFRTYRLDNFANNSKLQEIDVLLYHYRKTAIDIFNLVWSNFIKTGKVERFISLNSINSTLSERYKQTILAQTIGIIKSYLSNRQRQFKLYIKSLKIDDSLLKELYKINKTNSWLISKNKIASKIFKRLLKLNNLPYLKNISMNLDKKVATIIKSEYGEFDYWIKLSTINKGKPIMIPLKSNSYFDSIKGNIANFIQINNRDISLIKEINKSEYKPLTDKIAIDLGLCSLFVTNYGDRFGNSYFFNYLNKMDTIITKLISNLQKQGIKPNHSKKYRKLINKVRNFIKNNINRLLNLIVDRYKPQEIVMERLNFKSSNLSKRLNRILHKFGKGAITSKLDDFKNKLGITITEINPAYTSQTCNSCGYIAKNNRKSRDEFICVCCNKKSHADINASRNIFGRSSTPLKDIYLSKAFILDKLITRFIERQRSHYNLASLIVNNKYFNNYQQTLVE